MPNKFNNKILYLSFHNSLKKKFGVNHIIPIKIVLIKLGRQYLVPKSLRMAALRDLQRLGLLEKVDKENLRILDLAISLEDNVSKFYKG